MTPVQSAEARVGAPVNPVLGAKYLAGPEDLDFIVEGPLPLVWQRTYNSTNVRTGWFGRGWGSPLEATLEMVAEARGEQLAHVVYIDAFGRRIELPTLDPSTEYFSTAEQVTLLRTSSGRYGVRDRDGVLHYFETLGGERHVLVAIVDRNDNAIVLEHLPVTARTRTILVSCSGGQVIELRFGDDRLRSIVERRRTAKGSADVIHVGYDFDGAGNLSAVFNRVGECLRRFAYFEDRLMSYQKSAETFESWYEYVGSGSDARVVRHWNNVGESWTFAYLDDRTVVRDQDDRTTVYHCDERRRWIGFTDAAGRLTQRALDRDGNVRAIVDPAEQVSETVFDERGNAVQIRDADGAVTQYEWHERFALITAITDALNRTVRYEYDARGNLIVEVDPAGGKTRYRRDARGLATEIVDAHGGTRHLVHDERALLTAYTDCSGQTTLLDYDADGRLVCVTDALGQHTTYAYDDAGRLVRHTLADGTFEAYENGVDGNVLAVTDALGHRTRFEYADDARLTRRIDALGNSVSYTYDRARRLIGLTDENGARFEIDHDVLDRVVRERRFDGGVTCYEYDAADNLARKIEAPDSGERIETIYEHDAVGRTMSKRSRDRHVIFVYDAAGQMVRARERSIDLHLGYDAMGQVVEERLITPTSAFRLTHAFDALGNRTATTLPDGTTVGTLYYGSGHAHQIRVDDEAISDIERDALHREIGRTQGRLQTSRAYDPAGRLLRQRTADAADRHLVDRAYTYDRAGRLVVAADRTHRLTYDYDALDRLTRFDDERFAFDPAHNLVATGRGPRAAVGRVENGRVVMSEDKRYRYDALGRLVQKRIGAAAVVDFVWDDAHRLIETTRTTPDGAALTRYVYDPIGRRVAKETDVGVTWFVWVEDQLVQQIAGETSRTFVYEPDAFTPFAVGVGRTGQVGDKSILYYHCDQIGLPRELTDADGRLRWEGAYRGWGRLDSQRVDGVETSATALQPLRLEGQYDDEESGLYYSRFRYYDPDMAAFVTPDPIGLEGGENHYRYAPNPVDWSDPYGLFNKRRKNGQFAKKPGPKKKTDASHGCSLTTTKPAQGYELQDLDSGEVMKYGETTRGRARYTKAFLKSENVEMVFVEKGTKKQMKDWENKKILGYKASHGGCRPRLNKSDH